MKQEDNNLEVINSSNQEILKSPSLKTKKRNNELSQNISQLSSPNDISIVVPTQLDIILPPKLQQIEKEMKENSKAQVNCSDKNETKDSFNNPIIVPENKNVLDSLYSRILFLKKTFAPLCLSISGLISIGNLTILIIYAVLSCILIKDCLIYLSLGFATSSIIFFNSLRILITIMRNQKNLFSKCFFYGVIPLICVLLGDILYSLCTLKTDATSFSVIQDEECSSRQKKMKLAISISHLIISVIYLLFPIFATILIYRYNYNLSKLLSKNVTSLGEISGKAVGERQN